MAKDAAAKPRKRASRRRAMRILLMIVLPAIAVVVAMQLYANGGR